MMDSIRIVDANEENARFLFELMNDARHIANIEEKRETVYA